MYRKKVTLFITPQCKSTFKKGNPNLSLGSKMSSWVLSGQCCNTLNVNSNSNSQHKRGKNLSFEPSVSKFH